MSMHNIAPCRFTMVGSLFTGVCDYFLRLEGARASQGWGQVQLVKYSSTSSTRNQVQVQVQVL